MIYKSRLEKEVVVEEDLRSVMLNKIEKAIKSLGRRTREELSKDVSSVFKELIRAILNLSYEFTHEELIMELGKAKMDRALKSIIMSFSEDISKLKYSGYKLTKEEALSLLSEMKVITRLAIKEVKKQPQTKNE